MSITTLTGHTKIKGWHVSQQSSFTQKVCRIAPTKWQRGVETFDNAGIRAVKVKLPSWRAYLQWVQQQQWQPSTQLNQWHFLHYGLIGISFIGGGWVLIWIQMFLGIHKFKKVLIYSTTFESRLNISCCSLTVSETNSNVADKKTNATLYSHRCITNVQIKSQGPISWTIKNLNEFCAT